MSVSTCPHCGLTLTKPEAAQSTCPSCGKRLAPKASFFGERRRVVSSTGVEGGRTQFETTHERPQEPGEIQRVFKPGLENLIAGVIIGLLLLGGGITGAYFATRSVLRELNTVPLWSNNGPGWIGVLGLLAVGAAIGGFFLIRGMRSLSSLRVCVGPHGFRVIDRKTKHEFLWDDIASVEETHLYERPPILKGPAKFALPKLKSIFFTINRKDGESFDFDANKIRKHKDLAALIQAQTERRSVLWTVVEQDR